MLPRLHRRRRLHHAFGSWHTGALASDANQLAAMPSLHMAWAAGARWRVWRITKRRWLRALAVLYPCLTALAVLATGNHFLLDIFGGLLALAVSMLMVGSPDRLAGSCDAGQRLAGSTTPTGCRGSAYAAMATARSACHKVVTKSEIG